MKRIAFGVACVLLSVGQALWGREIFVDAAAKTSGDGSAQAPFHTVQEAANLAMPGDTVTIADGIYREWVRPPRGGTSDEKRITYRAAKGARPILTGGEPLTGWQEAGDGVWKLRVPDAFFAKWSGHNPFRDRIQGDWFAPLAPRCLRGMLIVNGVRSPMSDDSVEALRKAPAKGAPLVNVAAFTLADGTALPAGKVSASEGLKADGDGLTWIYDGAWARYDGVKAGDALRLRVSAAPLHGAVIEARDGSPTGRLLGCIYVGSTGGWERWDEVKLPLAAPASSLCLVFGRPGVTGRIRWTVERDADASTVYACFPTNPSTLSVEVTARPMVFYPTKTGCDYITLRGLTFRDGAPNWAPPTSEQEALVGTNWSRGWVIEDCEVYNSTCVGISLGKYGDCYDNTSANGAKGYVETIDRAGSFGWDKVGHHVVRNCHIHDCGQAGIVGSLGCAFSRVEGCTIHDVYVGEHFGGAEQAGIKFHGAVDARILNNTILRCGFFGIWLDWMAQGTRVSGNVVAESGRQDFFVEVSHGPTLADNNIFASANSVLLNAQGVAFVNNFIGGNVQIMRGERRLTPYLRPHSIQVAKMEEPNRAGDLRFFGNVWVKPVPADIKLPLPCFFRDNLVVPENALRVRMVSSEGPTVYRSEAWCKALEGKSIPTPKAEDLPMALIPKMPFEDVDGKPFLLDKDLMGAPRGATTLPGPYAN